MFYRIKENKLYDWADHKFADDCLQIQDVSVLDVYNKKYIVIDGELKLNPDYEDEQAQKAKEEKRAKLQKELDAVDLKSIRALRSNDTEYIAQYEQQAQDLRQQIQEL